MINFKKYINKIREIVFKVKEDNISEYAAEAAYFTILSFIPFTIFFLTLIKFTNIENSSIYIILKEFFPSNVSNTISNIIEEIYSKTINSLSFSIIIVIWAAGKGFFSLLKGIKNVYAVNIKNNFFLRIIGSLYTGILILVIIFFLLLLVIGNKIYIFIMTNFKNLSPIVYLIYRLRIIFVILLMTGIFYFLYKFIIGKNIKNFSHIYGAFFSSSAWQILSYFISMYVEFSTTFSNLYENLSSIILIMLWVYMCMYIVLLGAEVNVLINYKKINCIKRNYK